MSLSLLIFWTYSNKGPKGGKIQKIVNIEGSKGFHCVKYAYASSKNGFKLETMVILNSHMHRPHSPSKVQQRG